MKTIKKLLLSVAIFWSILALVGGFIYLFSILLDFNEYIALVLLVTVIGGGAIYFIAFDQV